MLRAGPVLFMHLHVSITISLNGTKVTELLNDPQCLKEGHIALQLHGGQDMRVQFKDLAIQELP